jgi:exportin-2 (importin alpha re-exporter)
MLALSSPSEKAIRAQVADAVSLIAELDFPAKWPTLIEVHDTFLSIVTFP